MILSLRKGEHGPSSPKYKNRTPYRLTSYNVLNPLGVISFLLTTEERYDRPCSRNDGILSWSTELTEDLLSRGFFVL